ncbi:ABC transporter ATP-binding protein [Alteromonas sp. KUL156]|nr:ABC transporter ATP-binding protein [Alteromonas sp. KUL154]GFE03645.1 ABC transporter ATP-binding protein [Alteromonas sp. KUL156]
MIFALYFISIAMKNSLKRFPTFRQLNQKDCGPSSLKIILKYYKKDVSIDIIRELCETTRRGSNLYYVSEASEKLGLKSMMLKIDLATLKNDMPLPCILHWDQKHYCVLYKVKNKKYYISDPAFGLVSYSEKEFIQRWQTANDNTGVALLLQPQLNFDNDTLENEDAPVIKATSLFKAYTQYKSLIIQLLLGFIATSVLQFIIPFFTQSFIDIGVQKQNLHFIYVILFAHFVFLIGLNSVEILRRWILLYLTTRVNISLLTDFFIKLMKLPMAYFDNRMTGDIMEKIKDHGIINKFLTQTSFNAFFSIFNIVIFSVILMLYDVGAFLIFFGLSAVSVIWILVFLKQRKILNHKQFSKLSEEQAKEIELILGMKEIKQNNAELLMRWEWEQLQAKIFKIDVKNLSLQNYQEGGAKFISNFRDISLTLYAAKLTLDGSITLGMLITIQYIIGQLSSLLLLFIDFINAAQDAKISFERIRDVHVLPEEEKEDSNIHINPFKSIFVKDLSFRYKSSPDNTLQNINLEIPVQKQTAIVGLSGSGKSTLFKILLKHYTDYEGQILLDHQNLSYVSTKAWRNKCGAVLQEGVIFDGTIAKNIALGYETIDREKLLKVTEIANCNSFINKLPKGLNTVVGGRLGVQLSSGEKQRVLIARALYRDPDFIFFDEASSDLDSVNEKSIMKNLEAYFKNKTVIAIAHRLSTIKNMDQIIVMDKGEIIERGNHENLMLLQGHYYNLVQNQLLLNT